MRGRYHYQKHRAGRGFHSSHYEMWAESRVAGPPRAFRKGEPMGFLFIFRVTQKSSLSSFLFFFKPCQILSHCNQDSIFFYFKLVLPFSTFSPPASSYILKPPILLGFFFIRHHKFIPLFLCKNYSCRLDRSFPATFLFIKKILSHLSRPSGSITFSLRQNSLQYLPFLNRVRQVFILYPRGILNKAKGQGLHRNRIICLHFYHFSCIRLGPF